MGTSYPQDCGSISMDPLLRATKLWTCFLITHVLRLRYRTQNILLQVGSVNPGIRDWAPLSHSASATVPWLRCGRWLASSSLRRRLSASALSLSSTKRPLDRVVTHYMKHSYLRVQSRRSASLVGCSTLSSLSHPVLRLIEVFSQ